MQEVDTISVMYKSWAWGISFVSSATDGFREQSLVAMKCSSVVRPSVDRMS